MGDLHGNSDLPQRTDGFISAKRLIDLSEDPEVTSGFVWTKRTTPKMDLRGSNFGGKRGPVSKAPTKTSSLPIDVSEDRLDEYRVNPPAPHEASPASHTVAQSTRLDSASTENVTIPSARSSTCPSPLASPSKDPGLSLDSPRPALSSSQASALKMSIGPVLNQFSDLPIQERLIFFPDSPKAHEDNRKSDAGSELPNNASASSPSSHDKSTEDTSQITDTFEVGGEEGSTTVMKDEPLSAVIDIPLGQRDQNPKPIKGDCVLSNERSLQKPSKENRIESPQIDPVDDFNPLINSSRATTMHTPRSLLDRPQTHQPLNVLCPQRSPDRVQKLVGGRRRHVIQTQEKSHAKSHYQTSDVVKLLAKKLHEEQQETAAATEEILRKQDEEIDRLNLLVENRDQKVAHLTGLQETAQTRAETIRKLQDKAGKLSKFMTGLGSDMNFLKTEHQVLQHDHAKLQLYSKDLECRTQQLRKEAENYQQKFREYRVQAQLDLTEAGGQLKLLSLRQTDLNKQRDENAALLAEERDRSTSLCQQLSKANERYDRLSSTLEENNDTTCRNLASLLCLLEELVQSKKSSPEFEQLVKMIEQLSSHKKQDTQELQVLGSLIHSAADSFSKRLQKVDENQDNQALQMASRNSQLEQLLLNLFDAFDSHQKSVTTINETKMSNTALTERLEGLNAVLIERTQQRDQLQAVEIRLNDRVIHLQADLQAIKEQRTVDSQLSVQVQRSEKEGVELRAKLISVEQNLLTTQRGFETEREAVQKLCDDNIALRTQLDMSQKESRDLIARVHEIEQNNQREIAEAHRQWDINSQKGLHDQKLQHEGALKILDCEKHQLQEQLQAMNTQLDTARLDYDLLECQVAFSEDSNEELKERLEGKTRVEDQTRSALSALETEKQEIESRLTVLAQKTDLHNADLIQKHQQAIKELQDLNEGSQTALSKLQQEMTDAARKYEAEKEKAVTIHQEAITQLWGDINASNAVRQQCEDDLKLARTDVYRATTNLNKEVETLAKLRTTLVAKDQEVAEMKAKLAQKALQTIETSAQGTQTIACEHNAALTDNEASVSADRQSQGTQPSTSDDAKLSGKKINQGNLEDFTSPRHDLELVAATSQLNSGGSSQSQDDWLPKRFMNFNLDSQSQQPSHVTPQADSDVFTDLDVVNPGMLSILDQYGEGNQRGNHTGQMVLKESEQNATIESDGRCDKQGNGIQHDQSHHLFSSPVSDVPPTTPRVQRTDQALCDFPTNIPKFASGASDGVSDAEKSPQDMNDELGGSSPPFSERRSQSSMLMSKLASDSSQGLAQKISLGVKEQTPKLIGRLKKPSLHIRDKGETRQDNTETPDSDESFMSAMTSQKPKHKYHHSIISSSQQSHDAQSSLQNIARSRTKPVKSSLKRQSTADVSVTTPHKMKKQKQVVHNDIPQMHTARPLSSGSQGSSQHSVTETHSISITTSSRVRSFTSPFAKQPVGRGASNQPRSSLGPSTEPPRKMGRKATRGSAPKFI